MTLKAELPDNSWQIVLGCLEDMGEKAIAQKLGDSLERPEWDKETKISVEELAKFLKVEDSEKIDIFDIDSHFGEYDAWLCHHCGDDVGNDLRDMIRHLMKHTVEELKVTQDGDPIEEEAEK